MRKEAVAALLVVAIVASGAAGYYIGNSSQRTTTVVSTATLAGTVTEGVFIINVNGSLYYADDVSSDTAIPNPGFLYFLNTSVSFDGVKFVTICPEGYEPCPVPQNQTVIQMTLPPMSLYQFRMTFRDGTSEIAGNVIGDSTYTFALSSHVSPRAGMLIEYVRYNYASNPTGNGPYDTFLLVSDPLQSSCGLFGCDISSTTAQNGQTP
jgi:hypothetical protein